MSSSNLKTLLTEYEKKRMHALYEAEEKKLELYKKEPLLQKIDDELSKEAISISKKMLVSNDPSLLINLNKKLSDLKNEKKNILSSLGKDENYLKPQYDCYDCLDTGYITSSYESVMCHCLKQKLFNLEYNKSNISNLEKDNFNNFSFDVYSNDINEEKYHSKLSPRKNMEFIFNLSNRFIENFNDQNEKNLLFSGNTGLGKSFLSSCIAGEILKKGKTVLYQTAPIMLDTIMDYRFGKNNTSKDIYDNLLNVDLLIIDDLGTECINNMKFSELFNIINTRLLNSKKVTKTIISTNLSLDNLFATYDERIVSRLVGNYNLCYFFGEDIRFKK
ncbi:MAG: ATP-binding protein [Clostridiaceae bacterium]|nr:ATP-binding protein [Clostridiaceae bacterium]